MSEVSKTEIIGGLLKRIGNFNNERFAWSFDERLIFQKTIYLLQAFGLYIGIPFSWYLHGPYSTILAKHGYALAKKFETTNIVRFTTATSENRFNEFIGFLGDRSRDAKWLEALASIHFLRSTFPSITKTKIITIVLKKQPYLTAKECEQAWSYLIKYNLIRERD